MILSADEVSRILQQRHINILFHANSVTTACTYLRAGGLLSRGAVEARGLNQSWQPSDNLDRQEGVWNDVFLDMVNIGERANCRNKYGPVLFQFNINVLQFVALPDLCITKHNPIHWRDRNIQLTERYYQTVGEFENTYVTGDFASMLTLRNTQDILPFNGYLSRIIFDNPNRGGQIFQNALNALNEARVQGHVATAIEVRDAGHDYDNMTQNSFSRFFSPVV